MQSFTIYKRLEALSDGPDASFIWAVSVHTKGRLSTSTLCSFCDKLGYFGEQVGEGAHVGLSTHRTEGRRGAGQRVWAAESCQPGFTSLRFAANLGYFQDPGGTHCLGRGPHIGSLSWVVTTPVFLCGNVYL